MECLHYKCNFVKKICILSQRFPEGLNEEIKECCYLGLFYRELQFRAALLKYFN